MTPDMYLFRSQRGVNRKMSRSQIAKIIHDIYDSHKMTGKLGMHAWRKTYAVTLYHILGKELLKTQRAMFHENINSTVRYLQDFTAADIDSAILSA